MRTDVADACAEAASSARAAMGAGPADVGIVFSTCGYDQSRLLGILRQRLEGLPIVGCSAEGIIGQRMSAETDKAMALMLVRSRHARFEVFGRGGFADDPHGCGAALGEEIASAASHDSVALVLFTDGVTGNCNAFLAALSERLPAGLKVVGGTAGDTMLFERTFQYRDDVALSGGVSALLISGAVELDCDLSHGCSPIGLQRRITAAREGWIEEIDGQPAWRVFKEYLDGDPRDLNAEGILHLCIGEPLPSEVADGYDAHIIRTPMDLDQSSGALFFPGGGVKVGTSIYLTRRDPEKIRAGAIACAERIAARHPGRQPAIVLQIDCAGRGRVLFGRDVASELVTPVQEIFGATTPWIGFHSYGEIAPLGGVPRYHNYTAALCALYDQVD